MIERAIERASHEQEPNQQHYSQILRDILGVAIRGGFVDPRKEVTYDILTRLQSKKKPTGAIEDAIVIALNRVFHHSKQEKWGQALLGILDMFKADGFVDPSVDSSNLNS